MGNKTLVNDIGDLKMMIKDINDKQLSMEKSVKDLVRRNDRMVKALKNNASLKENENNICAISRNNMPYITVDPIGKGGINYTFLINSKDAVMSEKMWGGYNGIQSEYELHMFFELASKYYGITPRKDGMFVDVGGNIGTTSIMVKKIYPDMNVIAFEPGNDNRKVFSANCILNECEITLIPKALGKTKANMELVLSDENMGNHRIKSGDVKGTKSENIKMTAFDDELKNMVDQIDYVWMDVEGYEGHVLEGMDECLKSGHFPIWMEFNPMMLTESGGLDSVYEILPSYFSKFIDRHESSDVRNIRDLKMIADELGYDGKATDIFLIRK